MSFKNSSVYAAGFIAGFEGRPVDSNPFSSDSVDFLTWDTGHMDGEYDANTEALSDEDIDEWDDDDCNTPANEGDYDDSMDGDFDSAMSSAGYGTDEDYGDYGCDYGDEGW